MFTRQDYDTLHKLVFSDDYPGYRPNVREIPNGDGRVDAEKRFSHVALKYLATDPRPSRVSALLGYLHAAHAQALSYAHACKLPLRLWPRLEACALRVLEYPPGAVTAKHTDFDLFTLNLWRDEPWLLWPNCGTVHQGELWEAFGLGQALPHWTEPATHPTHSIVYFALPGHDVELPAGGTVGAWLAERIARSRVAA